MQMADQRPAGEGRRRRVAVVVRVHDVGREAADRAHHAGYRLDRAQRRAAVERVPAHLDPSLDDLLPLGGEIARLGVQQVDPMSAGSELPACLELCPLEAADTVEPACGSENSHEMRW